MAEANTADDLLKEFLECLREQGPVSYDTGRRQVIALICAATAMACGLEGVERESSLPIAQHLLDQLDDQIAYHKVWDGD